MKIREIITESTLANLVEKLGPEYSSFPVFPRGTSKIGNYSGRVIVLPRIGGIHIPFYISTGGGGKTDVPAGKWYPIFGIGSSGWLNKLYGPYITSYYGSDKLRSISQWLDSNLGDLRNLADQTNSPIPTISLKMAASTINQNLKPTVWPESDEEKKLFKVNIDDTLKAIGAQPLFSKSTPAQNRERPGLWLSDDRKYIGPFHIDFVLGRPMLQPLENPDSKYYSTEQARIYREGDGWMIAPIRSATNQTLVDGQSLTAPRRIRIGNKISVGNVEKGIEKLPLTVK